MKCTQVKELLSDYIDGILDRHIKAILEEHVLACKDCKENLVSLKVLVNELNSLKSVEAPKDFVEQLHRRMGPSAKFDKTIRMLFVPPRIKIPLEFATISAMAILIFSILHFQRPEKQVADLVDTSTHLRIA